MADHNSISSDKLEGTTLTATLQAVLFAGRGDSFRINVNGFNCSGRCISPESLSQSVVTAQVADTRNIAPDIAGWKQYQFCTAELFLYGEHNLKTTTLLRRPPALALALCSERLTPYSEDLIARYTPVFITTIVLNKETGQDIFKEQNRVLLCPPREYISCLDPLSKKKKNKFLAKFLDNVVSSLRTQLRNNLGLDVTRPSSIRFVPERNGSLCNRHEMGYSTVLQVPGSSCCNNTDYWSGSGSESGRPEVTVIVCRDAGQPGVCRGNSTHHLSRSVILEATR
ncbi:hypothetical protein J6590_042078 [Homalodisca vitripennis]|nr:hypothetical protein J6590_042078 [Homalodisca vitripennis]